MISKVLYIILYIIFFLIDDIVVFVVAMKTLEISGVTTKYNKYSHLVGGILMILIGLLLIFKPEWIMLNF
jgi:threonine/homoserine/homoserine lactone efflux protein